MEIFFSLQASEEEGGPKKRVKDTRKQKDIFDKKEKVKDNKEQDQGARNKDKVKDTRKPKDIFDKKEKVKDTEEYEETESKKKVKDIRKATDLW